MMTYPQIDPVAFSLGPVDVHWYGLAYLAGFFCALWYMRWAMGRHRAPHMQPGYADDLFFWVVIGVILGGRLGYVFFYNWDYYSRHMDEIYQVWQGGMSFHGGALGVAVAVLLFAWSKRIHFADLTDRMAPGVCFGLFFGRLANFINGELYGRVTSADVPWAMVFPGAGDLPRHPSQLYEAGLEGMVLFLILHAMMLRRRIYRYEITGMFLIFYSLFRTFVEFFRQPDAIPELQGGIFDVMTMGQMLSVPMFIVGIVLLVISRRGTHLRV